MLIFGVNPPPVGKNKGGGIKLYRLGKIDNGLAVSFWLLVARRMRSKDATALLYEQTCKNIQKLYTNVQKLIQNVQKLVQIFENIRRHKDSKALRKINH